MAGDPVAMRTFAIFVDIYGAEAGNMALRLLARGGVYLAGGVAAKNIDRFTDGRFMDAFLRKGRFQNILAAIPVNLITNPKVGLLGAAGRKLRIESMTSRSYTPSSNEQISLTKLCQVRRREPRSWKGVANESSGPKSRGG